MFEETFEEYTERRIKSFEKLKEYFPEAYPQSDVNYLRNAYAYSDFLIFLKKKLEDLYGFKFTWEAFDSTYRDLWRCVNEYFKNSKSINYFESIDSHEKFIDFQIDSKKYFLKYLNISFDETLLYNMRKAFLEDYPMKNSWENVVNNIIAVKQKKENDE